jgi:DHA1 family tetracycline resistance protein-like MFS transporter
MNRNLWILFMAMLLWSLGFGLYNPVWPEFVRTLGGSPVDLGALASIATLAAAIGALPGGVWADRYERKTVLMITWVIAVPAPLIWAVAPDWRYLIPGSFLYSLSMASMPPMQAYMAGATTPENRTRAFGIVSAGFPIGMIVSQALSGIVLDALGFHNLFMISFGFFSASTLILFAIDRQQPHKLSISEHGGGKATHRARLPRRFWLMTGLFTLIFGLSGIPSSFFTPFLTDVGRLSLTVIGLLAAIAAASSAVFGPWFGHRAGSRGARNLIRLGWGIWCVAVLLMVFFPRALSVQVGSATLRGAADGARSLMNAQVAESVPAAAFGAAYGWYNLVTTLGLMVAPYLGGWLYTFAPRLPFLIAAIGLAVALVAMGNGER